MSSNSFTSKLFHASLWASIAKWVNNGLGIISTIILARILTPDDFGLVAMATLITAGFDVISRLGTDQYIIHKKDINADIINTAWSIQLTVKFLIFILLIITSLILPSFIDEPRLPPILMTLSITPLLMGVSNIGIVLLKKELQFKKIAKLEATAKISSFILTIALAYLLKNYWAFIYGMVLYYLVTFIGSYIISSYRPKLTFVNRKAQFSFSTWTLSKGVVNYLNGKIDQMLITHYLSISQFGSYSIGQRLNGIPTKLFISPVSTALFSGLAHSLHNKEEFKERVHKILFLVCLVSAPLAICLAILAPHLVPIALGDDPKWFMVVNILQILAPLIVTGALNGNIFNILTLLGKVKYLFYFELVSAITSALVFIYILESSQELLLDLLKAKIILSFSFLLIVLINLSKRIKLSFSRLTSSISSVIICSGATYLCSMYCYQFVHNMHHMLIIVLISILIIFVYTISIFLVIYLLRRINKDFQFCYNRIDIILKKLQGIRN